MNGAVHHTVPTPFIWRRVHSLLGLWLVVYLTEHLLVNSQAALWIGDDGHGFVRLVNLLESLPYLQVVEVVLIGIPLLLHAIWGIKRIFAAKENTKKSDGSKPSLGEYGRNRAFSWQRITSWILLFGLIAHVVQMRFLDFPKKAVLNQEEQSMVRVTFDEGLYTLAPRLGVALYSRSKVEKIKTEFRSLNQSLPIQKMGYLEGSRGQSYDFSTEEKLDRLQKSTEEKEWVKTLSSFHLKKNQVVAVSATPGTAMLLTLRDSFKNPILALLYTIFVLAAAFHAFNGFWTFLITWGIILSYPSQKSMIKVSLVGILLLSFLGLVAIWGSYWINLRY
jgi:succinate dehydrogenase / fumarate reductase cytochrome b subunit